MQNRAFTRDEALRMMEMFVPRMGRRYANGRNYDRGVGQHKDVSTLSPYIRRRLVTEQEVVRTALQAHGPENAEKFIQEVFWRGYFKGWLEQRPAIWSEYRDGLDRDLAEVEHDRALRKRVAEAEKGATGLACFDEWADELVTTGYLHNHARMWFASIWIFTLGLPWRIGADFFYRHLLDGDPASNTLSWRWVAGLHTRGKPYEAQAWNIRKFTGARFSPRDSDFARDVRALDTTEEPEGLPDVTPLRKIRRPELSAPSVILITEEDCQIEDFLSGMENIKAVATLSSSHLRSPREVASEVEAVEAQAMRDAAARTGMEASNLKAGDIRDLVRWAENSGARQVATPYIPEGPLRDWMREAIVALDEKGIAFCEWRRDWDAAIWPHATAGFFKVKKSIPRVLDELGLH